MTYSQKVLTSSLIKLVTHLTFQKAKLTTHFNIWSEYKSHIKRVYFVVECMIIVSP